ncbi:MAG: YitT family protein [Streptococcaceae bacterium]|nr:YitT family protein [Streptococcaceae bacterium]MCL2858732.1 YitT family protein [Streptococcaceae bacterium]
MKNELTVHARNFVGILIGTAIFAFGFVEFNMANHLAEGGMAGITLMLHALFKWDPSYMQIILNIPLLIIGYRYLGQRTFTYTIFALASSSVFIWLFQRLHIMINIDHDNLIAALLAGLFAGVGVGIVLRSGGTTGGSDIIAQLLQVKNGIQFGQTFFIIDIMVLSLSLATYIDVNHMVYTLLASFVASQVIGFVQSGGYAVRGMLIMTNKHEEVAQAVMNELGRGMTYLHGAGAYSKHEKEVIYVVLNPREVQTVKQLLNMIDENAFVSVINVHEVMGDFTYPRSKYRAIKK